MKFTDKALTYILSIRQPESFLRIKVVGGGCASYSYKMEFTKEKEDRDQEFSQGELTYLVDPKSWLFLKDVEVDYTDGLTGVGFTYNNPSAKRSCGCGTSFST